MKIMISQPMSGLSLSEIAYQRDKIERKLESLGHEVINSYCKEFNEENRCDLAHVPVYYLGKALQKMAECDAVYFAEGWELARGCVIERAVAEKYGLIIMEGEL